MWPGRLTGAIALAGALAVPAVPAGAETYVIRLPKVRAARTHTMTVRACRGYEVSLPGRHGTVALLGRVGRLSLSVRARY